MTMQRNWIGSSEGAEFDLPVAGRPDLAIRVFTTRPDTAFGMTYAVLAPEHPLVDQRGHATPPSATPSRDSAPRSRGSRRSSARPPIGPSAGSALPRASSIRSTTAAIPLFIADYVLMGYGTGAIMAVPGEDERDWEFAEQHGLPIIETVQAPGRLDRQGLHRRRRQDQLRASSTVSRSPRPSAAPSTGWSSSGVGAGKVNYRLRDWGISRQRYWGAPIPVLYCEACGMVPEAGGEPPRVLAARRPDQRQGRLAAGRAWRASSTRVSAVRRAGAARDGHDGHLRGVVVVLPPLLLARYDGGMFEPSAADYWMPVDQYIGGIEHAVLHLLYARFYTKVLRDLGLVKVDEPFTALLSQGMVIKDGAKMSKSKGNVVDPDDSSGQVRRRHRDGSSRSSRRRPRRTWSGTTTGIEGASRFLNRVWRFVIAHC